MFPILEISGTIAFAISGSLTAMQKKLDPFGVFIIAFVTAIGGGTLRDVMIGKTPVVWMQDLQHVYLIIFGFFLSIVFRKKLDRLRKSLLLFDTIGLGVFTLIGIQKGVEVGLDPIICIALGTITACFGGVIRDILCNEIPIIFSKEIYATICIIGGIVYFTLDWLDVPVNVIQLITSILIITIRLMAIKYNWCLKPISTN